MVELTRTPAQMIATRLGRLAVRPVGEGPTTVLWPSMFVDSTTWHPLLPHLEPGRRYVLVDGPGLGASDPLLRRSSIVEAADAATDLLEALGVDGPVDWVGNAFGGHVGLDLATRPGVLRSLVAISSPTEPVAAGLRMKILALAPLLRLAGPVGPVREAVVEAMLTAASAADPERRDVVVASLGRPTRRSMTNALRSFVLGRVDVTGALASATVPSLFVATDDRGDWSPQAAERSAGRAPDARFVVVEGARTLVPLEQPEVLAGHLHRFWAELRERDGAAR